MKGGPELGKAEATRSLRRPHPESRPPLLRATEGRAARPERGDACPPGPGTSGSPASHLRAPSIPRRAAQDSPGWAEPVPTTPARSPSHLHLPGLTAAIMPLTSPASASPRRGGRSRKDARVTCRRRFAALAWVSRWTPSSAGRTLPLFMGQGCACSAPGEASLPAPSQPGRPKRMT